MVTATKMEPSNWEENDSKENHSESVLRTMSISPPRDPHTRRPLNQFERPYVYRSGEEKLLNQHEEILPPYHSQYMTVRGETTPLCNQEQFDLLKEKSEDTFDKEMQCCDALLTEVKGLRTEYQSTMGILQKLYENQKRLSEVTSSLLKNSQPKYNIQLETSQDDRGRHSMINHHGQQSLADHAPHSMINQEPICCPDHDHSSLLALSMTTLTDNDDSSSTASTEKSDDTSNSNSSSSSSSSGTNDNHDDDAEYCFSDESTDAFVSHGLEAIETMWDDFSVNDYVPSSSWVSQGTDTATKTELKQWRPRITIPKPFSMTLREEQREKKKSKTLLKIEQEKLEEEALEEAELNKLFHANPVPATTYLPLYEMINAQQEKRRQHVRENSQKLLEAKQRPFSFVERELKKMAAKEKETEKKLEQECQQISDNMFKARPVPRNVLDSNIDEKFKEDEEYRRIRIRMRALELLANSHLPNRMKYNENECNIGQLRRQRQEELDKIAFLTTNHRFHPTVNGDVPDHKQMYKDFQRQLKERQKDGNMITVTQPFTHRTDSRILERQAKTKWSANDHESLACLTSSKSVPKVSQSCLKSSSKHSSAPLTRSAQLRHQANLYKLYKQEEQKELRKKDEDYQKRLQKEVSHRSIVNDVSFAMDFKRREKLRNLRFARHR